MVMKKKRQIDVSCGKLGMDASPNMFWTVQKLSIKQMNIMDAVSVILPQSTRAIGSRS